MASFSVIVLAPPPPAKLLSVSEVLNAYQDQAAGSGGTLTLRSLRTPPFPANASADQPAYMIAESIADGLGVPLESVRVSLVRTGGFGLATTTTNERQPNVTILAVPPGFSRPDVSGGVPRLPEVLRSTGLNFPAFETAVRQKDTSWTVISPREPILSLWHWRLLVAFIIAALTITPLAWWIARRITTPIRRLAAAADSFNGSTIFDKAPVQGPAEVRSAAVALNGMQTRMRSYLEERTAMLMAIAHDLRTPLTSLRIRTEAAPPKVRQQMKLDLYRMQAMVDQVLAFAESGTEREKIPTDLSMIVSDTVTRFRELGHAVSFDTTGQFLVVGDSVELTRLVDNLIDNAIKFGRRADVSLVKTETDVIVTVYDHGTGIPDETLDRVFEPFFRLEPSRSHVTGGVGLGLSIAQKIAGYHGGSINLANNLDGGLMATARFPLLRLPSTQADDVARRSSLAPQNSMTAGSVRTDPGRDGHSVTA